MSAEKYNLALVPTSINDRVVAVAQEFSSLAERYLLNGVNSLPHVTLYQFRTESHHLDRLWKRACELLAAQIHLTFHQVGYDTFNDITYFISLLPDQVEDLNDMHVLAAGALELPIKASFDPHMSLLDTKRRDYGKEVKEMVLPWLPLADVFVLALGKCDEVGQFTEIVFLGSP
jgi:hypothetical protein